MANGGIIGPVNIPTSTTATGVWQQEEQYEARVTDTWPERALFTTKSLRFNDNSSDYLNRTPSSAGNRRTFTISSWVKRSSLESGIKAIFSIGNSATSTAEANWFTFSFNGSTNRLRLVQYNTIIFDTNAVYRDVSAWYHVVVAVDTTQGTASNRVKLYVNGTQVTSFATVNYPSQNYDYAVNNTIQHMIGREDGNGSGYFDGYMAELIEVDGQALAPTSFGVANSDGVWTPIIYTGTYGTNGFNLQFENAAALGTDSSPNGNNFTVNNLTSIDQSTDYPVVNYATWNSLIPYVGGVSFEEGNLLYKNTQNTGSVQSSAPLTFGMTSGKWYAEFECDNRAGDYPHLGIAPTDLTADPMWGIGSSAIPMIAYGVDYNAVGNIHRLNSVIDSSVPSYTTGDVIGIALDLDNGRVYFSKNGTYVNSGNPSTGSNPYTFTKSDYEWTMGAGAYNGTIWKANFGSPPYAISSSNADGNGYGNFEYAVPSGYYALNTANLAEFG